MIIGGAEDKGVDNEERKDNSKYEEFEILKGLIPDQKGKKVEIITTASNAPKEVEEMYRDAFGRIGFRDIGFINIKDKVEARSADFCKRIAKAHTVFFSGGGQLKLSATLGGTETIKMVKEKYLNDSDFLVAGTSAGAMAMSQIMISEGGNHEAIIKDDLKMAGGLGILSNCIIDTHFIKRGRFGRLSHAIIMDPEALGIGLGEDTALLIKDDIAVCHGSGMVVIIDGNEILKTNITEIEDDCPIFVENLKVHLLSKGCSFSIAERKMR